MTGAGVSTELRLRWLCTCVLVGGVAVFLVRAQHKGAEMVEALEEMGGGIQAQDMTGAKAKPKNIFVWPPTAMAAERTVTW
jgi:hypothetical protein